MCAAISVQRAVFDIALDFAMAAPTFAAITKSSRAAVICIFVFCVFSCPLGCFVHHTTVKLYQIILLPCLGPPLPALRYVVYSTSGFANDVTFAHNRLRKVDASRPYTQSLTLSIRPRAAQKRGLSLTSTIALFYDDKDFSQKSYR